jgi:hypothetical protein
MSQPSIVEKGEKLGKVAEVQVVEMQGSYAIP